MDISGARAIDPQVAVDPSGNAVVVWENRNGATGIQARARSATGTLSDRQNLSPPGYYAFDPQAGIDQSGNAVFVWSRYDGSNNVRIEARARAAGGVLSKPQLLSAPGNDAHNPQVAVGPGGDAVFVWSRRDGTTDCGGRGCGRIQVRARSAAGVLSGVQTLSEPGQHAFSPQIGLDQTGNAVVVWSAAAAIRARARSSTGVLGAVQIISPTWVFGVPQLDVDQSGRAVIVWERFDASTDCDGHACLRIQTRARSAAGGLTAVQTVSAAGQTASHPQVAVDENGNAVFVWERTGETNCIDSSGDPTPCLLIQARARSAMGALSGGQTLSGVGQVAQHPQVAVDPSGKAVFVWQRYDGTKDCSWKPQGCSRIQSRVRTATGLLTATETLSAPAGEATSSQIGVDQAGNAVAVWQRFQANSFVQAATGP